MKERIKSIRKALGFTQQKFARRLGVKQNTIAQYEIGRNDPSDAVIISICREFNVSEGWLRNGTGSMFVSIPSDKAIDSFVNNAKKDNGFKKSFLYTLSKLDEDEWIFVEKFMESVLEGRGTI